MQSSGHRDSIDCFTSYGSVVQLCTVLLVYKVWERKELKPIQPLFLSDTDFEQKPQQRKKLCFFHLIFPFIKFTNWVLQLSICQRGAPDNPCSLQHTNIPLLRNTFSSPRRSALTDCRCSTSINHLPFPCVLHPIPRGCRA